MCREFANGQLTIPDAIDGTFELVCRGRRIDNREWVVGSYLDGSHMREGFALICPKLTFSERREEKDINGIVCGEFVFVDKSTVGVWLGKIDKNGTDIFSGDRVRVTYTVDGGDEIVEEITVRWNADECGFTPWTWEYACEGCVCNTEILTIEVIDNEMEEL